MKKLFYTIIVTILAGIVSCTELPIGQIPTDNVPPSPPTNVDVKATPGGARITYDLPNEKDISYVKCEYMYKGEQHVVRSSIYSNYLIIEGIGDTNPVDITVYVVDHSENSSIGIQKSFTPQTPPWEAIFESVEIMANFGGVTIKWTNETATEIGITVFTEDSLGIMREGRTQYSNEVDGELSFRGYDSIPYHFAVRITDKWGNVSTFKEATVTPLFEKAFNKALWSALVLPGDNNSLNSNPRPLSLCWNGNDNDTWHSDDRGGWFFPQYITIDLGLTVKFSRMRLLARPSYYYSNHTWRTFEAWGAKNYKRDMPVEYWTGNDWKTDGDWEMLGDFEIKRPSGSTEAVGNPSGEDGDFAKAGFGFDVSFEKETLQYIRFIIKTTWSNAGAMHMGEFYFYGDDRQ
ncbi:MAG: DUF5126 domain-containing protein [Prevotellaceae bacterium]|jgi:hypothetical protein|nr:DUF5126 domain-containing protein [Prevotellaceae bacterium]